MSAKNVKFYAVFFILLLLMCQERVMIAAISVRTTEIKKRDM